MKDMRYYPTTNNPQPPTSASWSPSIHSSSYVPAKSRDAWMVGSTQTHNDIVTGLSTIEGVDLYAEVPCDGETCDMRADYKVKRHCPGCGTAEWGRGIGPHTRLVCHQHWVLGSGDTSLRRCTKCGCAGAKGEFYRIVEVLR